MIGMRSEIERAKKDGNYTANLVLKTRIGGAEKIVPKDHSRVAALSLMMSTRGVQDLTVVYPSLRMMTRDAPDQTVAEDRKLDKFIDALANSILAIA